MLFSKLTVLSAIAVFALVVAAATTTTTTIAISLSSAALNASNSIAPTLANHFNVSAKLTLFRRILDYFTDGYNNDNKGTDEGDETNDDDAECVDNNVKERYLYEDETDADNNCDEYTNVDYSDDCTDSDDDDDDEWEYKYYYIRKQLEPTPAELYNISFIGRKELVLGQSDDVKRDSPNGRTQLLLGGVFGQLPLVKEIQRLGQETVMLPAFATVTNYFNERSRIGALKLSQSFKKAKWHSLYQLIIQNNYNNTADDNSFHQFEVVNLTPGVLDRAKKILKSKVLLRAKFLQSQSLMPETVAYALSSLDPDTVVHTLKSASNVTLPMVNGTAVRMRDRHLLHIHRLLSSRTKQAKFTFHNGTNATNGSTPLIGSNRTNITTIISTNVTSGGCGSNMRLSMWIALLGVLWM